jgi:hypothetical protein
VTSFAFRRARGPIAALSALLAVAAAPAAPAGATPRLRPNRSPDQRARGLEAQMTLAEKVELVTGTSLCGGGADGYVAGDPRLGLPALNLLERGSAVARRAATPISDRSTGAESAMQLVA